MMKRLILLFLLFIMPVMAFGQLQIRLDSLTVPGGTDTTVYIPVQRAIAILCDYKDFDTNNAVLNWGLTPHPDSLIFDQVDDDRIPHTCSDSSVTIINADGFSSIWMAMKLTGNSVTEGKKLYYWIISRR